MKGRHKGKYRYKRIEFFLLGKKNKNKNRSQTRSITSGNWLAPSFPAQNALGTDLNRTLLRNDPGDLGEKQTTGASSGVTSKLGISARGYLSDTDTQIIHKATNDYWTQIITNLSGSPLAQHFKFAISERDFYTR